MGSRTRARKPTLDEKKKIAGAGLDWKEWNVLGRREDGPLRLINKKNGDRKVIGG